jgi:hypothetical protein
MKQKLRKETRVLIVLTILLTVYSIISFVISLFVDDRTIFEETASFGEFRRSIVESFEVLEDSRLHITVFSEIENGAVYLVVSSPSGEIIFSVEGANVDIREYLLIPSGRWHLHFECGVRTDDNILLDATNGKYSIEVIRME